MLEVTINGLSQSLTEELTIFEALTRIGIAVPSVCHDPRLKPAGDCRLCLVQIAEYKVTAGRVERLDATPLPNNQ